MFEDILKVSRGTSSSGEQFSLWGKTAAKRFIEDGVNLNESIRKIASDNGLNSHEIDRVVQAANLETYAHLLKQADPHDKSFEFPVADRSMVVSPESSTEKTAMPKAFFTDFDRAMDDDLGRFSGVDLREAFGVALAEKLAQDNARAEGLLQKLQRLAELERDKIAASLECCMEDAEKFYQYIKQEVLAGKTFDEVEEAVKAKAGVSAYAERVGDLTAYVKRRLYDAGLLQLPARTGDSTDDPTRADTEKKAEPVEPGLLTDMWESPGVAVSVINGRHPLFAIIDTLIRQFEEADKSRHNLIILEDKIRYVKHRIYGKKQPL